MTRKEFLEQAAKQVNFQNFNDTRENALDCIRINSAITTNMDFLLDFFFKNGFNGGISDFHDTKKSQMIFCEFHSVLTPKYFFLERYQSICRYDCVYKRLHISRHFPSY